MRAFKWVNLKGMKFDPVSTSNSAKAGNEKFAGKDKNPVGMELLKSPVAGESGVSWNANEGTRGIKKPIRIPALVDSNQPRVFREPGCATHTTHRPKTKKTVNLQVNQLPQMPRFPLLQSFHA